ncbi:hypothetical protein V6N13_087502 [Hibiscus sabdariffa]
MEDPPSFLSSFFGVFMKGKSSRKSEPSEGNEKQTRSRNPVALPEEILRQFSLDQIRAATCNFRRDLIIGHGAFGTVYKAFFDDGNLVVAVKRLKPDFERGESRFRSGAYGEYTYEEASLGAFVPPHKCRAESDVVESNSSDAESVSGLAYPTMDSGDIKSIASEE